MAKEVKAGVKIKGKDASKGAFDSLSKSLSKTDLKLKGLANKMAPLAKGFGIVGGAALAAAGAMIGATVGIAKAVYKTVDATATYLDELAKFSRQTGFAVEALQQLDFVAKRNGLGFEKNRSSIVRFSKVLADIKTGATVSQLEKVDKGLYRQMKAAPDAATAYFILMDSLARMEDKTKKSAIAFAIFGKTGQEVLRLVDGGPEAFAALRKEAEKYGIVLGADAAKAEAFKDAQENMQQAIFGLKTALSIDLMPALAEGAQKMADFIAANRPHILAATSVLVDNLQQAIKGLVDYLTANPDAIVNFVKKASDAMATVIQQFKDMEKFIADIKGLVGAGPDRQAQALARSGATIEEMPTAGGGIRGVGSRISSGFRAGAGAFSDMTTAEKLAAGAGLFGIPLGAVPLGKIGSAALGAATATSTQNIKMEVTVKPQHGLEAGVAVAPGAGPVSVAPPKVDENYFGGGF